MTRTALITGAARRIGAALAAEAVALGYDLALHYHSSREEAEATAAPLRESGRRVELFQADLGVAEDVERLAPEVFAAFGGLDLLVNNASMFSYDRLDSLERPAWDRHLAVNFTAPVFLIRDYARLLPQDGRGLVVNLLDQKIASPNPDYLSYTAGKMGLAGMTEPLALALAPRIRLCGIAPGVTLPSGRQDEADFQRAAASTPLGETCSLADLRGALRFLVETPSITGRTLIVDGGESLLKRGRDVAYDV
jgi:NAD(P)-dependent dehydrogenase (short-subunit alcohol dehydrogenase family)